MKIRIKPNPQRWPLLFLFIILLVSDDTVLFGTNGNPLFIQIKYGVIICLSTGLFLKCVLLKRYVRNDFLIAVIMGLVIIASSIWNNDLRSGVYYKLVLLMFAYALTQGFSLQEYAYYYERVMCILAVMSILGYILGLMADSLIRILPKLTNNAGAVFYNGIFFVIPESVVYRTRNFGVFREPGVYQMFLIVALMINVGVLKSFSMKKLLIYIIAIITTMSTTGYIALAVLFGVMLLQSGKLNKKYSHAVVVIIAILVVYAFVQPERITMAWENVFGKLRDIKRHTTIARFGSITENLRIFKENVIFGAGITKLAELFPIYCFQRYGFSTPHNTNTILIQYASHGVVYGSLYSVGLIKLCKSLSTNTLDYILYILLLVIILLGENLTYSLFTYIFVFYGYKKRSVGQITNL